MAQRSDRADTPSSGSLTRYAHQTVGWDKIPYPIYPNGSRYRIGGEQGMKIIAFETTDSFQAVDRYYQNLAEKKGYTRTSLMADFVEYRARLDEWRDQPVKVDVALATRNDAARSAHITSMMLDQPAIIIHRFVDADDALQYGADAQSQTNIIMRYP